MSLPNLCKVYLDSPKVVEGGAIQITAIFNNAPDGVTIQIYSPSSLLCVETAMTAVGDRTFTYVYQTVIDQLSGEYEMYIQATKDSNTFSTLEYFRIVEQRAV